MLSRDEDLLPESSLWKTNDGITWTELASFPSGILVNALSVNGNGLAVIGSRPGAESEIVSAFGRLGTGATFVWTSPDGVAWTEAQLELAQEPTFSSSVTGVDIANNGERWVAMGVVRADLHALVFDHLPDDIRQVVESDEGVGFGWGGPPYTFTISGPGGVPLYSADVSELGLTDEDEALVEASMGFSRFLDRDNVGEREWR